ncbi:MAG: peptidase M20 [Phototrophicales bacterium]|nr:MAG: peptidase M20 [Phototrophicales bacterium]
MKNWLPIFEQKFNSALISGYVERVIDLAIAVQQIPAPTFEEQQRAHFVRDQFLSMELQAVEIDDLYNVYGMIPGEQRDCPGVMIAAHTDTVFSAHTDLSIHRHQETIYGAGLGDNSAGVAGLLVLAQVLTDLNYTPPGDLWFVATTREEGLGDLGGMRAAFDRLSRRIGAVINLEGLAFGHIYNAGIAVRRYHITATAPGGHSWLHFGRPSAINAILEVGTQIIGLKVPDQPRTTFNIGMIEGGESINSIAAQAGLWLDLRSEDSATLAQLVERVQQIIASQETAEVQFTVEQVGDRPSGVLSADHPLVTAALESLERVGFRGTLESGSTDANVPLSLGVPAVTIGITRGGNAHRLDEYMEIAPIESGMRQLIMLTLAASAWMAKKGMP